MASTEKLTRRIEELEGVVKKCYSQIEILSEKVHYLEKKQSIPNRRACLNHHAVKRHQRNAKYDFDSSSSDGSFNAKQSKSKGSVTREPQSLGGRSRPQQHVCSRSTHRR
ncbi:hypothetical protein KUTeg_003169 [Tegillarca granosa]|uniref:Uncharacterized protein n=1 Tax=Tegillarca granosa TaxID=220873 RepID=A0ABQ9FLD7_TEGGR|nr:hypothetical protein KUTeg_003169 [Tegillarca granosa]